MSYHSTQLGGRPFNHKQSSDAETEYDRLRGLAREEHGKQQSCAAKSRQAYERGDGAAAHELSEEGKRHAQMKDQYNKQASDFIFRENNAEGRVASDTIDLHGQFVEEAEEIVEQRIRYAQSTGQTHLHVIVGKGNHSPDHIQKIKPRVEQICRELGLSEHTEHNEGRIYIDLTGGQAQMPPDTGYHPQYGGQQHYYDQYGGGGGGGSSYPGQQQQNYGGGQQGQNDELEEAVKKNLPKIIRALKSCCVVM